MLRSILRFLLQIAVLAVIVRALVKYTTLDDKVIAFFRANSSLDNPPTPITGHVNTGVVSQHRACTTPWGETILDGTYIIAYESTESCNFEKRYCYDGHLEGSFSANHCNSPVAGHNTTPTINAPVVNTVSYGYVEGMTVHTTDYDGPDRAPTANVTVIRSWNDNKTNPLTVYENNNPYRGVKTWNYKNLDLSQRGCTTPWGSFIDHGDRVIAYASPYPARPGASCTYERRTCFQGRLGGSYAYSHCSIANNNNIYNNNGGDNYRWPTLPPIYPSQGSSGKSCTTPRGTKIANGSSVVAYASNSYPCYSQLRTCTNGKLAGSYQYKSCNNTQPGCHGDSCGYNDDDCHDGTCGGNNYPNKSCSLPWGGSIPHGAKIEAYQNPTAPCYKQIRTCSNGKLSGNFGYASCQPTTTPPQAGTDTYSSWSAAGQFEGNIDSKDTCNSNATASYLCGTESSQSCIDYAKISCTSFSPMICTYQKRSVQCVK